ncbi:stage III sporulation protein AA [Oceanobacillus massiliensis]|uniref:stage III sporulation protein AA n=1 Tax=Oceanobacillus massiliensis TaxID=1465765 RepID=UPI00301A355D
MEEIMRLFPGEIRQAIQRRIGDRWNYLQEIRIRLYRPIELIFDDAAEWLELVVPDNKDGTYLINQLSSFSLYRMEDELREGYITVEGGHRVGIAGRVITSSGKVKALQNITFFNIRIAKEKIGSATGLVQHIFSRKYLNTLIVGPPQTGKTTLIRDLTRLIASGYGKISPRKVGVIDERSEIGASLKGVPQHNLGLRTDVLDACPKSDGMMMMIRSMSPDVLVVDEIGSGEDIAALMEAINAGVTIICSIHGNDLKELKKRPSLQQLFEQQIFDRYILLDKLHRPGEAAKILDKKETELLSRTRGVKDEVDWSTAFNRDSHINRV